MEKEKIAILDLMARVDGEKPFERVDELVDVELDFESMDEAERVFEQTLNLREAVRVQSPTSDIPEEWLEPINSFSAEARPPKASLGAIISQKFSDLLSSIQSKPYSWGGGFATACAFVIVVGQPSGDVTLEGIGGQVTSQDPQAMFEALDGEFKNKTSLETETQDDTGSNDINLSNFSTNSSHSGLTAAKVKADDADNCSAQNKSATDENETINGSEQPNCRDTGELR